MKNKTLIGVFLAILLLPALAMLLGWGGNFKLEENRRLAYRPTILNEQFPALFTDYFNDHFGMRAEMIVAERWLEFKLFKVSPNSSGVTVGKNDWLFYTPDVQYIDSVNGEPFSTGELEQIKNNLLGVERSLAAKNIKFYFLVAPNKQSIYPEYLPNYMKKVRPDSRLDQLTSYLKDNKEINFVNPKDELLAAKKASPVYLKYDSHWNDMGAFVAYQKLGEVLKKDDKNISVKQLDDYNLVEKTAVNKDLIDVEMGLKGNFSETEKNFEIKGSQQKIEKGDCEGIYTTCPFLTRETNNSKLPKLVMFRDSFSNNLIPFLADNFSESTYYWGAYPFSSNLIDKAKPEVVIVELTERELWRLKDKIFEF